MKRQTVPDWGEMIDALMRAGLTIRQVGDCMSVQVTERMLHHYRNGAQPLHWRGEALIGLWCRTLRRERDEVPLMDLVRGHRVDRNRETSGPVLRSLPAWPPCPAPSVQPLRRGRRKVAMA